MRDLDTFNEEEYLRANPDVGSAVANGEIPSGRAHYESFGRREGRALRILTSRREKILAGLDVTHLSGIEIGPLSAPLVKKEEGEIIYVDYASADFLKEQYKSDPNVNIHEIVEVDAIWGSNSLREATGTERRFDYVVASHVIEHVPDLITWLAEIHSVLKDDGKLCLAVPDRRFTFDYLRHESTLADLVDAYLRKARAPLPRMILDFCFLSRTVNVTDAWAGPLDVSSLVPMYEPEGAIRLARNAYETGVYHDVHCWVFTPKSFAELMVQSSDLGLINFCCDNFMSTEINALEFFVRMRPTDNRLEIAESWKAAARKAGAN
jgi:SAM-dependent methyltransferase